MIKKLLYKWFGLEPDECPTCILLKEQLEFSERERKSLLDKLLERSEPKPEPAVDVKEFKPLTPHHVPWRVRQQLLEQEDRIRALKLKEKNEEIDKLEKELGVKDAVE